MQGASEQCMQATEMERSPGLPSLMVTTRRRFTPQGTSCSFLQAVTQALPSMQRSASQRNFIRAIFQLLPLRRLYAAKCGFAFLHAGHHVVAVGARRVAGLTQAIGIGARRILVTEILPLPLAAEVEGHASHAPAAPLGPHPPPQHLAAFRAVHPDH